VSTISYAFPDDEIKSAAKTVLKRMNPNNII
jgi:hypothetical protein